MKVRHLSESIVCLAISAFQGMLNSSELLVSLSRHSRSYRNGWLPSNWEMQSIQIDHSALDNLRATGMAGSGCKTRPRPHSTFQDHGGHPFLRKLSYAPPIVASHNSKVLSGTNRCITQLNFPEFALETCQTYATNVQLHTWHLSTPWHQSLNLTKPSWLLQTMFVLWRTTLT